MNYYEKTMEELEREWASAKAAMERLFSGYKAGEDVSATVTVALSELGYVEKLLRDFRDGPKPALPNTETVPVEKVSFQQGFINDTIQELCPTITEGDLSDMVSVAFTAREYRREYYRGWDTVRIPRSIFENADQMGELVSAINDDCYDWFDMDCKDSETESFDIEYERADEDSG